MVLRDRFAGTSFQKGAALTREGRYQAVLAGIGIFLLAQAVTEIASNVIENSFYDATLHGRSQSAAFWVFPAVRGVIGGVLFVWYRGHTVRTPLSDPDAIDERE